MGWIPRLGSLWMAYPSLSAPHFVSHEHFVPPSRKDWSIDNLVSFSWSFIWSVNFFLGIVSFWANIGLSVSEYHVWFFCDWDTILRMIFSSSIYLHANFMKWLFYTCAVPHCVNVNYFLYPFLCWGTSSFFPVLSIINKSAISLREHVSLLYDEASFGYMPRSGIVVSSCSTISKFQRKHQSDV